MEQQKFFRFLKKTIREEVRNVIKQELSEILKEGLQTTVNELKEEKLPKKKILRKSVKKQPQFKKTGFADILNETEIASESSTVSNYANIMNESYNDLSFSSADAQGFGMMRQSQAPSVMEDPDTGKPMQVTDTVAKAMTRDYSSLMKAIDKKKNK